MWKRIFVAMCMVALAVSLSLSTWILEGGEAAASNRPAKVSGLTAKSVTAQSITLKWKGAKSAKGYAVYMKEGGRFKIQKTVKKKKAKITGLSGNTVYQFKVRAFAKKNGKKIWGRYSKMISVKTKAAQGIDGGDDGTGDADSGVYDHVSKAAVNIFCEGVSEAGDDENVLISPFSVVNALGIVENGAAGQTQDEIAAVISDGMDLDSFNSCISSMNDRMNASDEAKWNVANALWANEGMGVKLKADFTDSLSRFYNAKVENVLFDSSTADAINSWADEQTDHMIPQIVDNVNPSDLIYILNAVAFEGEWADDYEDEDIEEDCVFTNSKGQTQNVTMLNSEESGYMEYGKGVGFVRYYKGYDYCFVGLLPDEGVSVKDYAASIEGSSFSEAFSSLRYGKAYVKLPEFSYDYSILLNPVLNNLGMRKAFTSSADYSNMLEDGEAMISQVLHKTHIEVDRAGTRASAVTSVTMTASALPMEEDIKYIYLDRPFVYAIVDAETGYPVFLGTVNSID